MSKLNIIFHLPLPINRNATDASGIRPQRMIEAFKTIGCDIDVISGYGAERKKAIRAVKEKIVNGVKYALVYSENSLAPTLLTDPHRLPLYPILDFGFFKFCKTHNIPIGLFYRDIYWLFPEYRKQYHWLKYQAGVFFHTYDLKKYQELVDIIYLPSTQMAHYIPIISKNKFDALPPGHDGGAVDDLANAQSSALQLLYIGGLGTQYRLHELFDAIRRLPEVQLTICTREKDWLIVKDTYPQSIPGNIKIVHESGVALKSLYAKADIAMLFLQPSDYREFAVPFKLFEYIGMQKPIIASQGTLTGDFVEAHDIGWAIPYKSDVLIKLLQEIIGNHSLITQKRKNLKVVSESHTWAIRAKKVISDLLPKLG